MQFKQRSIHFGQYFFQYINKYWGGGNIFLNCEPSTTQIQMYKESAYMESAYMERASFWIRESQSSLCTNSLYLFTNTLHTSVFWHSQVTVPKQQCLTLLALLPPHLTWAIMNLLVTGETSLIVAAAEHIKTTQRWAKWKMPYTAGTRTGS